MRCWRGVDVRVVDLLTPPVHDGRVPAYVPKDVDFIRGDVRDPNCMRRAAGRELRIPHGGLPGLSARLQHVLHDQFGRDGAAVRADPRRVPPGAARRGRVVAGRVRRRAVHVRGDGACTPARGPKSSCRRGEWEHRCPQCGTSRAGLDRRGRDASPQRVRTLQARSGRPRDALARGTGFPAWRSATRSCRDPGSHSGMRIRVRCAASRCRWAGRHRSSTRMDASCATTWGSATWCVPTCFRSSGSRWHRFLQCGGRPFGHRPRACGPGRAGRGPRMRETRDRPVPRRRHAPYSIRRLAPQERAAGAWRTSSRGSYGATWSGRWPIPTSTMRLRALRSG